MLSVVPEHTKNVWEEQTIAAELILLVSHVYCCDLGFNENIKLAQHN